MRQDHFEGLVAALESQGMTRTEIAEQSGLSRATVWRVAVGDARRPSHETVERLVALNNFRSVSPMKQKRV